MLILLIILTVISHVSHTAETNITLIMISNSEVCPGELVTIRCTLYSPERQLLWICPEGGSNDRSVFCNSGNNIHDLVCNQGTFSVAVFCNDSEGSIVSDATYNATTEVGNLTCADVNNASIKSSLEFGAQVPIAPVLSLVEGSDPRNGVMICWISSLDSNTQYSIFIIPSSPHCTDPCVYTTSEACLSIPLEVDNQYNITGRAERCNGTLSSNESAVLRITPHKEGESKDQTKKDIIIRAVPGTLVAVAIILVVIIVPICIVCYCRRRKIIYTQKNITWQRGIKNALDPIQKGSVAVDVERQVAYFSSFKTNTVHCYDVVKNEWSKLTCEEKEHFSVAVIRGYLTAVGGLANNTPQKTLLRYENEQWRRVLPSMNSGREYPAVITTDTCVVVASGKQEANTSVEVLLLESGCWTLSSLPKPVPYPIGTIFNGMIFLMDWDGNYHTCSMDMLCSTREQESNKVWSRNEYFSPSKKKNFKKIEHAAPVTINNRLFLVGGHTGKYNEVLMDINELKYNEKDKKWTCHPFSTLPIPRFRCLAAALPGNRLLVVGGCKQNDRGDTIKIFNIAHLGKLRQ